jgi:NitT/TauT family transport system substrate-binding protein
MSMKTILAAFAVAAAVLAADHARAEDLLRVSVPQRGAWDTGIAELGQRGGIFKKYGLKLEILYTQGGAESIQAVIARSMDIATGVGVSAAIGTFAKGAPIRVIGNEMIGSPDLFWYVLPNSPVRTIADMNGKTIGYSVAGSSSHAGLLELMQQYKLADAKPVSLGGMQATFTQAMTGQVDVGWAAAPFALDAVEQGKVRIVARGTDVTALRGRTVRVNVTHLEMLEKHKDLIERFMRGYRDTVEWMYADPVALKHYAEFSGLPDSIVRSVRDFIPKETLSPDRIVGMDQVVADAVKLKFIPAPLTKAQEDDFVRIPPAK